MMRLLIALAISLLVAACSEQSRSANTQPQVCGPGGMGCAQGPMPYGDIPGAVGGSSGAF